MWPKVVIISQKRLVKLVPPHVNPKKGEEVGFSADLVVTEMVVKG